MVSYSSDNVPAHVLECVHDVRLVFAFAKLGGAAYPREAREDTVLFPAFRGIVSAHEFDSLGEDFEKKEDELFGQGGFFKVVDHVAEIEKQLGIYDLAHFTPKV